MSKKEKSIEKQAKDFFDREKREYEKRMKQAEIDREKLAKAEEVNSEAKADQTETETETQENQTEGEQKID